METIARTLIGIGVMLVIVGIALYFGNKLGLGKLPGDIFIDKGNFKFFFPITTSILISVILSILLRLFRK